MFPRRKSASLKICSGRQNNDDNDDCKKPCVCKETKEPLTATLISLIKSVKQKIPDQKDYVAAENDFWTLRLESPFVSFNKGRDIYFLAHFTTLGGTPVSQPHYWTFGFNNTRDFANLTTPSDSKILFTAGRFLILYDYEYETFVSLEGHKNTIKCLSVDTSGRFAASCDEDEGNKIVLWDIHQRSPVDVVANFGSDSGTRSVWMSPCARYLVAHHSTKKYQSLLFYSWTTDDKERKIIIELDEALDVVKSVAFSPDNPEFFALTTNRRILFLTYVPGTRAEKAKIKIHNGEFIHDPAVGNFIASTYLSQTHLCYSATETGHIRVWSDLEFYDGMCKEMELSNVKDEITYSQITSAAITVITSIEKFLVIANDMGRILFYTYTLVLVFCLEHEDLRSIVHLSFDVQRENGEKSEEIASSEQRRANTVFILGRLCRKKRRDVKEWQKAADMSFVLPRNLADDPEAFVVNNCIVCCKNEKIGYINFTRKSIIYLLENFIRGVVAIECHPLRDYVVFATKKGALYLVDYVMNQEIVKQAVLPLNVTSDGSFSARGFVCSMKYSFDGYSLVCGLTNGHIIFLSPLLLESKYVLKYGYRPIRILRFSPDGVLLAACDTTRIYFIQITPEGPSLVAAQKTHGRVITDLILFTKPSGETACFSIGKDKNLVVYDVQKTYTQREVVIRKCVRIEQRCDPLCLALAPDQRHIILGKSDFKLQIVDVEDLVYINNKHAPVLTDPINNLCLLNQKDECEYLFFTARNLIGLVKMPLGHNPFKWMTIPVSENKIKHYVFSKDRNFLFTLSKGEGLVNMWKVMPGLLEVLSSNVGGDEELFKYENLLGKDREFYLKEIKDYYAYATLIHKGIGINTTVNPSIPVCEVPDILRALGCFFTNYEMECVIRKGEPREKFKVEDRKMDFDELVELFASGKQFADIRQNDIENAFYRVCSMVSGSKDPKTITRNDFIQILTTKGETMQLCESLYFLRTLVDPMNKEKSKVEIEKQKMAIRNEDDQSIDFMFLPDIITYSYFVKSILGLSKKKHEKRTIWEHKIAQSKLEEDEREREEENKKKAQLTYRRKFIETGLKNKKELINKDPCRKKKGKPIKR